MIRHLLSKMACLVVGHYPLYEITYEEKYWWKKIVDEIIERNKDNKTQIVVELAYLLNTLNFNPKLGHCYMHTKVYCRRCGKLIGEYRTPVKTGMESIIKIINNSLKVDDNE